MREGYNGVSPPPALNFDFIEVISDISFGYSVAYSTESNYLNYSVNRKILEWPTSEMIVVLTYIA